MVKPNLPESTGRRAGLALPVPQPSSPPSCAPNRMRLFAAAELQRAEELLKKKMSGLCIREQPELPVTLGTAYPSLISPLKGDFLTVEQPFGGSVGGRHGLASHGRRGFMAWPHCCLYEIRLQGPFIARGLAWLSRGTPLQLPRGPGEEGPAPVTSQAQEPPNSDL